jgi:hypothetical protein
MSGIQVLKAIYGSGGSVVDVTSAVTAHIHDGTLNMPVSVDAFGVNDPAVGTPKQVTITYTINGGSVNTMVESDGSTIFIAAPGSDSAGEGLVIIKAEYGYPGNYTDVTQAVQNYVSGGSVSLTVGYSAVGIPDPNPNKQKSLKVEYSINGAKNAKTLTDGKKFELSAPPDSGAGHRKPPADYVTSFIGVLMKNVAYFFLIFVQALSVFIAYRYGENSISPYLWAGIAFFIPGFSFWLLPFYVFVVSLFGFNSA